MKLHSLRHHGTHAFPRAIELDLEALPPLIAVSGPNGAGKTTLFDVCVAPLIGEFPYRPGALARHFATPGAIELAWSTSGRRYRSVLKVDPASERTEGTLLDETGTVLAGPLIRDYRRVVQAIAGPPDLLLAAGYSVQSGIGAFLTASRAERKALLSELLGLGRYAIWHGAAKDRGRGCETRLEALRAQVETLTARAGTRPQLEADRAVTADERAIASRNLDRVQRTLDEAQATIATAMADLAVLAPVGTDLAMVRAGVAELERQREDLIRRRAKNAEVLDQDAAIRAAAVEVGRLRDEAEALGRQIQTAETSRAEAWLLVERAHNARDVAAREVQRNERDRDQLAHQAEQLGAVPCLGEGVYAGCPLLKEARGAHEELPAVDARLDAARAALDASRVPSVPDDMAPVYRSRRTAILERLKALESTAELLGPLEAARARLEELDGRLALIETGLAESGQRQEALQAQLAQRPALEAAEGAARQSLAAARIERQTAQTSLTSAERLLGQLEGQLAAVAEAEAALAQAQTEVEPLGIDIADWSLLVKALGPTGIPALLIDQALPELGRLATELLRECYGESVFAIALRTQREAASGDKLLETLDVVVTRAGTPIDAALLSGGEKVLVSEALSLALALYTAGRSGRRIETLLRDEVAAALDVDRAPAYTRMLRRAAQLGGFRHVLFVSHHTRAIELADARLEVRDGALHVS